MLLGFSRRVGPPSPCILHATNMPGSNRNPTRPFLIFRFDEIGPLRQALETRASYAAWAAVYGLATCVAVGNRFQKGMLSSRQARCLREWRHSVQNWRLRSLSPHRRYWSQEMRNLMVGGLCSFLVAVLCSPHASVGQESEEELRLDSLVPHWDLGDRWTVETVSRPLHVRADVSLTTSSPPLRWQFEVSRLDESLSRECFRVEVTCQTQGQGIPKTAFWLDRESFALRRITTFLPIPGGFEEMTISYDAGSGQPAPILGPLSAVPIDTPVLYAGAKGLQTFCYTSHFGATQRKELGDVGFVHQVEQQISELPQDEVRKLFSEHFAKSLVDDPFAKSLTTRPVTEVRLKSQGREIRQLWQPQRPWPIYCDNGYTVSRLVSAERPGEMSSEEDRP